MNNAVFGKTIVNVRNRIKMRLTNDDDNAIKWFSNVNFKTASHVDGMFFIQMEYEEVKMNTFWCRNQRFRFIKSYHDEFSL